MAADHLLHIGPDERGRVHLYLTCIADVGEHYTLWEHTCDCECEMCTGEDPDHWGCSRAEHDYSLDGAAPCQSKLDTEHCYTSWIDDIDGTAGGEFPTDCAPWPVSVDYLGDGEVRITYAPTGLYGECDCSGCNSESGFDTYEKEKKK